MCGICGFTGAGLSDLPVLQDMCDVMAHRGPDGQGNFVCEGVALGHRRLALVDVDGGTQPFVRAHNGTFAITFNGEIYNHVELRGQLERLGWRFKTRCDTEVLLVAYMEWGEGCLMRLRGMFAFVIWDGRRRRLFCARDPFGIKPFYYTVQGTRFIFASEVKAILKHPAYRRALNHEALEQYLCFQFSALPETFFQGVHKLPAAHWASVDERGRMELHRYWMPMPVPDLALEADEASAMVDATLRDSVHLHAQADVPVGSLLSGGVDSGYLTALLCEEGSSVATFTAGFAERFGFTDEADRAARLAAAVGAESQAHMVSEREYWSTVGRVLWHMDEPTGDPAAIALFFADALASRQVKAVFSGEGADELFGGYRVYQAALEARRLRAVPASVLRVAERMARRMGIRGANYLHRAQCRPRDWYYTNANQKAFSPEERTLVLRQPCVSAAPQQLAAPLYARVAHLSDLAQMQYVDLHLWLIEDILQKTDRMAMAHSLESRVPYLDLRVYEAAAKLPDPLRTTRKQTKETLRHAAARVLPQECASRAKLGFPVPLCAWLRSDARQAQLRALFTSPIARELFCTDALLGMLDAHRAGRDLSRRIWLIFAFLVWHRIYLE